MQPAGRELVVMVVALHASKAAHRVRHCGWAEVPARSTSAASYGESRTELTGQLLDYAVAVELRTSPALTGLIKELASH